MKKKFIGMKLPEKGSQRSGTFYVVLSPLLSANATMVEVNLDEPIRDTLRRWVQERRLNLDEMVLANRLSEHFERHAGGSIPTSETEMLGPRIRFGQGETWGEYFEFFAPGQRVILTTVPTDTILNVGTWLDYGDRQIPFNFDTTDDGPEKGGDDPIIMATDLFRAPRGKVLFVQAPNGSVYAYDKDEFRNYLNHREQRRINEPMTRLRIPPEVRLEMLNTLNSNQLVDSVTWVSSIEGNNTQFAQGANEPPPLPELREGDEQWRRDLEMLRRQDTANLTSRQIRRLNELEEAERNAELRLRGQQQTPSGPLPRTRAGGLSTSGDEELRGIVDTLRQRGEPPRRRTGPGFTVEEVERRQDYMDAYVRAHVLALLGLPHNTEDMAMVGSSNDVPPRYFYNLHGMTEDRNMPPNWRIENEGVRRDLLIHLFRLSGNGIERNMNAAIEHIMDANPSPIDDPDFQMLYDSWQTQQMMRQGLVGAIPTRASRASSPAPSSLRQRASPDLTSQGIIRADFRRMLATDNTGRRMAALMQLIDQGLDPNDLYDVPRRRTYLMAAVRAKRLDVVRALATMNGVNLGLRDHEGRTALDLVRRGRHGEEFRRLLREDPEEDQN